MDNFKMSPLEILDLFYKNDGTIYNDDISKVFDVEPSEFDKIVTNLNMTQHISASRWYDVDYIICFHLTPLGYEYYRNMRQDKLYKKIPLFISASSLVVSIIAVLISLLK